MFVLSTREANLDPQVNITLWAINPKVQFQLPFNSHYPFPTVT